MAPTLRTRVHRPSNRLENRVDTEFRLRKGLIVLAPGEARGRRGSQPRTRRCASEWACGPEAEGGSSPVASQEVPRGGRARSDAVRSDSVGVLYTRVDFNRPFGLG